MSENGIDKHAPSLSDPGSLWVLRRPPGGGRNGTRPPIKLWALDTWDVGATHPRSDETVTLNNRLRLRSVG